MTCPRCRMPLVFSRGSRVCVCRGCKGVQKREQFKRRESEPMRHLQDDDCDFQGPVQVVEKHGMGTRRAD